MKSPSQTKVTYAPFRTLALFVFTLLITLCFTSCQPEPQEILVFSKTAGFRHKSIEAGVSALKKLGAENGYKVTATEDSAYFVEDSLRNYAAVVFLNTTRDILNDVEQADFERYIQAGGGFVGVHAATDTEYDWPWYNKLVGAVFNGHPKVQEADLHIEDKNHSSTQALPDSVWVKSDEWYNFKNINPNINVVLSVDEKSYEGGTNGMTIPFRGTTNTTADGPSTPSWAIPTKPTRTQNSWPTCWEGSSTP